MIEPSRRQREDARRGTFELHRQLAGAEAWHRRITVASLAALVGSAAAWLVGPPLGWHVTAVVVAFLAGLAWPVPDTTTRALGWIAGRAGLAYETALTVGSATGQTETGDPYGFRQALGDRARASTARVQPPRRQHWWIAVLAVALGLLLLPAAQLVGPAAGTNGVGGPPETTAPVSPEPEADEPLVDLEEPEEFERGAEPRDNAGDSQSPADGDLAPGASGDQEPLSRVLDNLRERDNPFRSVEAPQEEGTPAAPVSQQREDEPPQDADGAQQRSRGQEPGEAEEGQEPGAAAEGTGEPGEGDEQSDEGRSEEGPDEGEGEGTPGPTAGDENAPEREGDTPAGGQEPGDGEGELDPDASSGIGQGPSAPRPTDGLEEGPGQQPEFLPGQLERGPENPGGSVLLPGEGDIDVPDELRQREYRRAVEEAVTDGQVPLEYQEIIRNYFR